MRRTRKGFTLVELLIVITIIAILIGLITVGLTTYSKRASIADTQTTLRSLQAMLSDYQGDLPVASLTVNAVDFNANSGAARKDPQVIRQTALVLARLRSIPANKKAMDNLPSDKLMTTPDGPIVLDAWNNPILFIPGRPRDNNDPNLPFGLRVVPGGMPLIKAPNDRAFFASAGPDETLAKPGDTDNVYSFQN